MSLARLIFMYGDPVENAMNDEAWARELHRLEDERKREEERQREKIARDLRRRAGMKMDPVVFFALQREEDALDCAHREFMDKVATGLYENWEFPL
jgi:hypothetical protein